MSTPVRSDGPDAPLRQPRYLQSHRCLGALIGLAAGYAVSSHLATVASTLISSLILGSTGLLSGRNWSAGPWWALIGAAVGALIGTGTVLASALQQTTAAEGMLQRSLMILMVALAGSLAGRRLSLDARSTDRRHPRDVLRSASALTTGIFAVVVTATFILSGLDSARTFSSRLSTSLTILVAALTVPGWVAHLIGSQPLSQPERRAHD